MIDGFYIFETAKTLDHSEKKIVHQTYIFFIHIVSLDLARLNRDKNSSNTEKVQKKRLVERTFIEKK